MRQYLAGAYCAWHKAEVYSHCLVFRQECTATVLPSIIGQEPTVTT